MSAVPFEALRSLTPSLGTMNMPNQIQTQTRENLGPAEQIIRTLLSYTDHAVHNRPGMVVADGRFNIGVRWEPVTHKLEDGQKVVYRLVKTGNRTTKVRVGVLRDDGKIANGTHIEGEYRPAGLFPEVVAWMYTQATEVWKLDNEFCAHWASHAFSQDHRDLKVILAALMLVQNRKGDPIKDGDKVAFFDEDYRDVGEAMMLLYRKDGTDLNPKLLLRVHDVLSLPAIAEINHKLGFGKSARRPFFGRWEKAVVKWLGYREQNVKLLEGLVKAGFRSTVQELARRVGYKPETPKFFEILRWKQSQAKDGRRSLAIGKAVAAAETWEGLNEKAICQKITEEKPGWKRITGLLPKGIGLTRAIMAAAIEAKSLSDKDLIIATPTLEELGLLDVKDIKERWEKAVKSAEDMRAANIASRVQKAETKEKLQEAADTAVKKAVEEVIRGISVYVFVDISGSMHNCIEVAKGYIAKFLQGFPLESLHVAVFNSAGREVKIKHSSAAGVEQAFRGIGASGGTDYGAGVRALQQYKPAEDQDSLFFFVGDEQAELFTAAVRASGLNPMAFAFVKVSGTAEDVAVRDTAAQLGIPCIMVDEKMFADPYSIPRTLRNLVASTPVGRSTRTVAAPRVSLIDTILGTPILALPTWA